MARARTVTFGLVLAAAVAGAGAIVGLVVSKRVQTGSWSMPSGDDVVRVKKGLTGGEAAPSRLLYLHRGAVELRGGVDDAPRGRSSVVGGPEDRAVMPGFRGNHQRWQQIVACVRDRFAPFDVAVTDALPAREDYLMVVVGGRPRDVRPGGGHGHTRGLAPFRPGEPIPRAVVFAFADALRNRVRPICETIAMEVGHAYGLDHAHDCKDVMTYLGGCGKKRFTDHDAPCGEDEPRACADGAPTQNSYRRLLEVLGPRR